MITIRKLAAMLLVALLALMPSIATAQKPADIT